MRNIALAASVAVIALVAAGCSKADGRKDRGDATDMFERIRRLTLEYTEKLESAPDSADWATLCSEFEEKLDKVNFSYPPDTDLLLTEGQNDTIFFLMQEYARIRDERIYGILHPEPVVDSLAVSDSLATVEAAEESTSRSDASHSHGN